MGLKGYFDPRSTEILFWDENAKLRNCRDYDDILIDQLGGTLPNPSSWSLSPKQARLLAGVYKRANKELAHLTATFNEDDVVDEAAKLVEQMLNAHLYTVVGEKMPKIDA